MTRILWTPDVGGPLDVYRAVERMDLAGERVMTSSFRIKGVAVGGCIEAAGTDRRGAFRRRAHAHIHTGDPQRGWVCFNSDNPRRVTTPSGRPTRLFWHEWAHVFANAGHTQRFLALLHGVGQHAEARSVERAVNAPPPIKYRPRETGQQGDVR